MLYSFVRPFVTIFHNVFYRIHYRGLENIPMGKPVVFAPNHVNGFVDPIVIAIACKQKVRFFARSDVFNSSLKKRILNSLSVSPMYRIREGFAEVKKNEQAFEECKKLLAENKSILIFPEGDCVQEKRIRKLKKGLARIVFYTEEAFNFEKDVLVVPVGLNYSEPTKFRSNLCVEFGKPISAASYANSYKENKAKAITDFTQEIEDSLKGAVVVQKYPENDDLFKQLCLLLKPKLLVDKGFEVDNVEQGYLMEKEIAAKISNTQNVNPANIDSLKKACEACLVELKKNNIQDALQLFVPNTGMLNLIFHLFVCVLAVPLFTVAFLVNAPAYLISGWLTKRMVKDNVFVGSFALNLGMIFWLVQYTVELLTIKSLLGNYNALICAMAIPILGMYLLFFTSYAKKVLRRLSAFSRVNTLDAIRAKHLTAVVEAYRK
ncbi:MAG: 1-acyl-sn-glycerol-3-phosphate acyltransferase [Bacteroidetes bacterium]|nr:1-acyl-sn-glycerol-3-phosphate acyltransferase [Bacteroidota bacterium]